MNEDVIERLNALKAELEALGCKVEIRVLVTVGRPDADTELARLRDSNEWKGLMLEHYEQRLEELEGFLQDLGLPKTLSVGQMIEAKARLGGA